MSASIPRTGYFEAHDSSILILFMLFNVISIKTICYLKTLGLNKDIWCNGRNLPLFATCRLYNKTRPEGS